MIRIRTFLATLSIVVFLSACSDVIRYALLGTREHATTEGEARLSPHDGGGYDLAIDIDRLPTDERLGIPNPHFIVWVRAGNAPSPVLATELRVDPTTRRGVGTAVVPRGSLELRVTAESTADPTAPSGQVLVEAVLEPAD